MRLFLDTSVILAACGSAKGASREVVRLSAVNGWHLVITPYVLSEVQRNLQVLGSGAQSEWVNLGNKLFSMPDILSIDHPSVFPISKDRPVLFSALAWADVLLTLDRADFSTLLGHEFYGMAILKPGDFLQRERKSGRLKLI